MKKILLISNKVMHYRVPVYNYFFKRFKENGWKFQVIANELQKKNPHPLDFEFKELPFNFGEYKREIEKIKPDAVIIFLHLKDLLIWPLVHWLKLRGTPVAFWTKGANLDRPGDMKSFILYKYMHNVVDGIILYSQHEKTLISESNQHKVFVANNTVNFEDFPHIQNSVEQIKKEFGIPFKKTVLSVGRMGEGGGRKKIDHLVEIFRGIHNEGVGLVIVGSGMTPELKQRMNPSNTLYLGEIYDPHHIQISKLFKAADVFSIPGHIGLGINQAFYWGLPVVTEDGLQPPEINYLVDGRNGFLVPHNDIEALKEKILLLLKKDDLRKKMAEKAREDILKNGSVEGMFKGFLHCVCFLDNEGHSKQLQQL